MRKRPDLAQSSDIAFLLILFFLILATLGQAKVFTLDLPQQNTASPSGSREALSITLHHDGMMTSDDNPIAPTELIPLLSKQPHLQLLIEGETPWQEVVALLSLIEQYPPKSLLMEAL